MGVDGGYENERSRGVMRDLKKVRREDTNDEEDITIQKKRRIPYDSMMMLPISLSSLRVVFDKRLLARTMSAVRRSSMAMVVTSS